MYIQQATEFKANLAKHCQMSTFNNSVCLSSTRQSKCSCMFIQAQSLPSISKHKNIRSRPYELWYFEIFCEERGGEYLPLHPSKEFLQLIRKAIYGRNFKNTQQTVIPTKKYLCQLQVQRNPNTKSTNQGSKHLI